MANHRALVVEDSRTIACVMKHYLQLEGFEVLQTVRRGKDAAA